MLVEIRETGTARVGVRTEFDHEVYVVTSPLDCRSTVAREACELALEFGAAITLGCVVATPA